MRNNGQSNASNSIVERKEDSPGKFSYCAKRLSSGTLNFSSLWSLSFVIVRIGILRNRKLWTLPLFSTISNVTFLNATEGLSFRFAHTNLHESLDGSRLVSSVKARSRQRRVRRTDSRHLF